MVSRTGPRPHPTTQSVYRHGRSGGGEGRCGPAHADKALTFSQGKVRGYRFPGT